VSYRDSSLHKAIKSGNTEAVRALLAGGADVNATNDAGQTALVVAIVAGQRQCLRPLLRAGADPWLKDHTGLTAIDWAKRKGETQLAHSLSTHSQSEESDIPADASRPPAREHKPPQLPVESHPRTPITPDEKARRFVTGLKQRLDEKAGREPTNQPTASEEKGPVDYEQVLETISQAVKSAPSTPAPHAEASPVIPEKVASPELPRPGQVKTTADQQKTPPEPTTRQTYGKASETVKPEIVTKVGVAEKATSPIGDQYTPARKQTTRQPYRKAADPLPETISPQVVTKVDVMAEDEEFASPSPQHKTRGSSKRKRCPECGTVYNSELLAYCSYDAAALVDEGVPSVSPRPQNPSPLLWILVVIVALLGAITGLFVTERLLRRSNVETPAVAQPQPEPPQKGVPVPRGQLEGKELTLVEAEVPANTVKEATLVVVRVRVGRNGQVSAATSTEEERVLREAAVEAAKKSTFSAEKLKGRVVQGTISYTFK
jgi:Ankyrin repeats (many copies)